MNFKSIIVTLFAAINVLNAQIIPEPKSMVYSSGEFHLYKKNKSVSISAAKEIQNNVTLVDLIGDVLDYPDITFGPQKNQIELKKIPINALKNNIPDFNGETGAYEININPNKITIQYAENTGLIHALMSLKQLGNKSNNTYPCLNIKDYPTYNYRGMHLDVSRHFFDATFIKKYIKMLAFYKFNTFHWHLTDDQGWRIEIKKYPKLSQIAAFRNGSQYGKYSDQTFDTIRYGGYYSQEEIKEVVKYAKDLGIQIIPEIEMPGHALAVLSAYPEFSCNQQPLNAATGWGVFDDVFCAGNDQTFEFLQNVLDEVIALFPDSKYVHIGGDECPKTRWKTCTKCQNRIKENGLRDEHELQSYFIQRIEKHINSKGKFIIGWDEILEGGLAPNATVMSWRGISGGIEAANQNHNVVMTPGKPCYFDHYQGDKSSEPIAIGGYNPLDSVYFFNPMPKELDASKQKYILGAQANVWTEYMVNKEAVEYMTLPRASALSEVLWSGRNNISRSELEVKFTKYKSALETHKPIWSSWNWNYRK